MQRPRVPPRRRSRYRSRRCDESDPWPTPERAAAAALASCRAGCAFAKGGLGRGKARDRHPERRARHVIELDLVAEGDRGGIAAVLAADAEFQVFARLAATLGGDANELADAVAGDRHARTAR